MTPLTTARLSELLDQLPAPGALAELLAAPLELVRVDRAHNARRYYALAWQTDLFGQGGLTRTWGRLGRAKRTRTEPYPDPAAAASRLRALLRTRLRHGYVVQPPAQP